MSRFLVPAVLISFAILSGCSRSTPSDTLEPGASVAVTMQDGSVVTGRVVESRADRLVIDPAEGGEWKTLQRSQVASVKETTEVPPADASPTQAAPPATDAPGAGRTGTATRTPDRRSAAAPPTAAAPPSAPAEPSVEFREVTIPENTLVHVRLDTALASDTSQVEDAVRASLSKPITVDGDAIVPAGSHLQGVVTDAKPSGKVKGRAIIAFRFHTLGAVGDQYRISTQPIAREAESTTKQDAAKVAIPAAGGAIIGGILGGGKGAAIGGAIGGGAGTAAVVTTKGKEVHLPVGTAVTVRLLEPVTVRIPVNR